MVMMRSLLQAGALSNSQPPAPVPKGGRAGDALNMGCPTQLVQCQKTYRQCLLWVQKRTFAVQNGMSALPPQPDILLKSLHVR